MLTYNFLPLLVVAFTLNTSFVSSQASLPVNTETGVSAYPFDISQIKLTQGRWLSNQERTRNYLTWVDVDRLLFNFRANHNLSTQGATYNGGWDAPWFPFRTHMQGHFLNAWSYCWATERNTACRDRAVYFVQELAKCQANNKAAGFNQGYLSGFPESDFASLENRTLSGGNVPYYAIHKTLAGLLDVWKHIGDNTARDVLLSLAGWVDFRTSNLTYAQMQALLSTEFGGMNEVLADIYHQTGNKRWLTTAQRFDHAAVFDPLAANQDKLSGLHANTQVPKWIGAAREYKATGTKRYKDIAQNAWDMTVSAHTYAIGGNSQDEHFREPNAIAAHLKKETCEACNTYNMLKLTRELWATNPSNSGYFDFYEHALLNHLLGQQDPSNSHGHVTYFTPLNPGGRRGLGPGWGGGTWSTDYDSFWCCQGTGLETNTKFMDSIYFYDNEGLFINLFSPSILTWTQKSIKITQTTTYPVADTTKLTITGGSTGADAGKWTLRIRIPAWTSNPEISINNQKQSLNAKSGSYVSISRAWKSGDVINIRIPMKLRLIPAKDQPSISAVAFGPVVLSGNYKDDNLTAPPTLNLDTVKRVGSGLGFTGKADGKSVNLGPFFDAHGFNYNVYWNTTGKLS